MEPLTQTRHAYLGWTLEDYVSKLSKSEMLALAAAVKGAAVVLGWVLYHLLGA